jgi:hypothetical protein
MRGFVSPDGVYVKVRVFIYRQGVYGSIPNIIGREESATFETRVVLSVSGRDKHGDEKQSMDRTASYVFHFLLLMTFKVLAKRD